MDAVGQVVCAELMTSRDTVDIAVGAYHDVHCAVTALAMPRVWSGGTCTGARYLASRDMEESVPYVGDGVIPVYTPTRAERHSLKMLSPHEETVNNFLGAPARQQDKLLGNCDLAVVGDTNVAGDGGMVASKAATNQQLTVVCSGCEILLSFIIK